MKDFLSGKSFKVLVAVVSVMLVLVIVTAGNSTVGTYIVNFLTMPMQQITAGAVGDAGNAMQPQKSAEELEQEVSRLEDENRKLKDMLVDYYDVKEQNEQLKKYYKLKEENPDYDLVPATVIRRDPNENFYGFTLDKGKLDGVEKNSPVVTENGLVGWVCEVDATSCRVKTILSPDTQVGALDSKTSDSGIITGSSKYSDDNLTTMTKLSAQHKMSKGDIIVTSGLGGIFPQKLKIGEVKEILLDEYDSLPVAVIEPYEDIRNVSGVAVITNYLGKGEVTKNEAAANKNNSKEASSTDKTGKSDSSEENT